MATTTTTTTTTPLLQTAQILADLSALYIADPASALHMMSSYHPLPNTRDRNAARTLSIPDDPKTARAKAAAARRASSTKSPASPTTTRSSPAAGTSTSPTAERGVGERPNPSPVVGQSSSSGSGSAARARATALLEEAEEEDVDLRRARMLLRCFEERRRLRGVGGGVEVLGEARRVVEGVRMGLVGRGERR